MKPTQPTHPHELPPHLARLRVIASILLLVGWASLPLLRGEIAPPIAIARLFLVIWMACLAPTFYRGLASLRETRQTPTRPRARLRSEPRGYTPRGRVFTTPRDDYLGTRLDRSA